MKQLKNLTILLTFLSLVAFISCSNEDSTGSDTGTNSENNAGENGTSGNGTTSGSGGQTVSASYVGDQYLENNNINKMMTINSDGSITIDDIGKVTNITKKSDTNFVMQYNKEEHGVSVSVTFDIKFSSYNSGTVTITSAASGTQSGEPTTLKIYKK